MARYNFSYINSLILKFLKELDGTKAMVLGKKIKRILCSKTFSAR